MRLRAKEKLSKKKKGTLPGVPEDPKRLIEELRVHQIELEMQNDELRKAQGVIEESRRKYVDLYDFAPVGYYTLSSTGEILEANLTGAKLLGFDRAKIRGMRFSAFVAKDFRIGFLNHCLKVLKEDQKAHCEMKMVRKDGSSFYAVMESVVIAGGQRGKIRAVVTDITERKRVENVLRRGELRYRSFVEVTSEWAWVTDAGGLVVEDVPMLRRFSGQTYEQAKGAGWATALHPDDVQRALEVWNQAVAAKTFYETEYRMRRHDGVYRLLLARGVPVLDEQGNILEWVGTCIDITERKEAEEALRTAHDELEMRVQERTKELRKSQERLRDLASQLLVTEEKERKRIAHELHDGLMSELSAMKFRCEARVALLVKGKPVDSSEFIINMSGAIQKVMSDTRAIMYNLHPPILDELGLIPTINWLLREYQKTYDHIQVQKQVAVVEEDIPFEKKIVIFRVLQEALNNFAKYGNGKLGKDFAFKIRESLLLNIQDNGQGFNMKTVQKGLGLESMRERVELSGGEFQIESSCWPRNHNPGNLEDLKKMSRSGVLLSSYHLTFPNGIAYIFHISKPNINAVSCYSLPLQYTAYRPPLNCQIFLQFPNF